MMSTRERNKQRKWVTHAESSSLSAVAIGVAISPKMVVPEKMVEQRSCAGKLRTAHKVCERVKGNAKPREMYREAASG